MTKEDFTKMWKKLLIDVGISESELWRQMDIKQANGNKKTRNASIRFIEFDDILNFMGYKIEIVKKA